MLFFGEKKVLCKFEALICCTKDMWPRLSCRNKIKLFFTSVNQDKQLINSLGKMWILLISFSTSDFVYLPKHEFNGQLILTIYQDLNNGSKKSLENISWKTETKFWKIEENEGKRFHSELFYICFFILTVVCISFI